MENTPEVPQGNPTEASNEFLGGWEKEITLGLSAFSLSLWSGIAGLNLGWGHTETALVSGIVAGFSGVATVLLGRSMAVENRSLIDQVDRLQDQDGK